MIPHVKNIHRVCTCAALGALALLSACSGGAAAPTASGDGGPLDAHRMVLPEAEPLPANADGTAQWTTTGQGAMFGVAGADPLLTLSCHDGHLVITRHIVAELGTGALFAIEGPKRIVRIPVDATAIPGKRGYVWQGTMDSTDPDADVFDGPFTGTLPGGGLINVTAGQQPRDVVRECRAGRPATP